jgi:myo-inositol 2-dehydrogenase/D-chiro-inositol 1-dehydrogenase
MRIGVIGAGLMGATHARLLSEEVPGAELVATADPVAPATYKDGLELIASPDVEGVVIASPAITHEPYTLACLEAGKPVLCEKPLAVDAAAARRIVDADTGGLVTVGFMRRCDPGYVGLKAQMDAIGPPVIVHCAHRNPSVHAFFDSAMIITDTVVHEVDITRWLLGQEIVRVQVMTPRPSSRAREGLRDPQLVIFETEGGQLVTVEAFVSAGYGYDIQCEVVGEAGTAALPVAVSQNFQQRFEAAYQHELERWVAGEPGASAWDGYAAAAVCEAAVESLETGAPVDVSLDRRGATSAAR